MSSTWTDWRVMFEEDMKIPGFKERFEKSYEEFKRENAADLAAERAVAERARALFPYRKNRVRAKEKPAFALQRKRVVA